ncbi:MAG TPA: heavy metal-associated domain-containing protein [Pseudonocardiaceae bacterium]|jgi:copper ion binding protein
MADIATVSEYRVTGMTCKHCIAAITEEVGAVPGVTDVRVDLAAGRVSVTGGSPLDDAALRAAIDEAGYEVVG